MLLRVAEPAHRSLVRELLLAHEFWHTHGLKVDLVIVNEHPAGYFDSFQEQLLELIHTTSRLPLYKPGGVYLLRAAQLSPDEDSVLLQEVAAISLHGDKGSLVAASGCGHARRRPRTRRCYRIATLRRDVNSPQDSPIATWREPLRICEPTSAVSMRMAIT